MVTLIKEQPTLELLDESDSQLTKTKTVEVYKCDTEEEYQNYLDDAENDGSFTLTGHDVKFHEAKYDRKTEEIKSPEYYELKLKKTF